MTKRATDGNFDYSYDANDRLQSDGVNSYSWDNNGNMVGKAGPGNNATYSYDPENRLTEANTLTGLTRFAYDASGNRIKRTTTATETQFLIDPNMPFAQVLEESNGSSVVQYIHGYDLLARITSGATRWYAYDGLGSTRGLTDDNGTLTDEYLYEGFGSIIKKAGASPNEFMFTGEQFEAQINMYYLRARYYEPQCGRFLSVDPLGLIPARPSSINGYLYVDSNPVNDIDPSGKLSLVGHLVMISLIGMLFLTSPVADFGEYLTNFIFCFAAAYEIFLFSCWLGFTVAYYRGGFTPKSPPCPFPTKHRGRLSPDHIDGIDATKNELWDGLYPIYGDDLVIRVDQSALGQSGEILYNQVTRGKIICDVQAFSRSTLRPLSPPYEVQDIGTGFTVKDMAYGNQIFVKVPYSSSK